MVKVKVPDEYDASVTLNEDGQLPCTDPSVIAPFVASEYVPYTEQVPSTPPTTRAKMFPLLMANAAVYAPDAKVTQYEPLGIDWPFAKTEQQPNRTAKIAIPRKNVFEAILNGICNVLFDKQKLREHNKRNTGGTQITRNNNYRGTHITVILINIIFWVLKFSCSKAVF